MPEVSKVEAILFLNNLNNFYSIVAVALHCLPIKQFTLLRSPNIPFHGTWRHLTINYTNTTINYIQLRRY